MSIFIDALAFEGEQLATIKLAALSGSVIAAMLGMVLLGQAKPPGKTADAEAATTRKRLQRGSG